ncbi:hypothetical protein ACI2K4_01015 [Micromonospora sp. NPDC050397]|uniref:hypothetical protein n=1 Tax=Micromonospora sp. NPDC050397 TaxID=3364279 RepID=UPI00384D6BC0
MNPAGAVPALATVLATIVLGPSSPTTPPGAEPPTIVVDRARAAPGDRVTVRLDRWPAGTVSIEICGNGGRRGSADCAVQTAVQTYVRPSGTGVTSVTVTAPPVGCPCVVRVTALGGTTSGTVPLAVAGLPEQPVEPVTPAGSSGVARLRVTGVEVIGGRSWPALFGGPAERVLFVTVRNDGVAPAVDPAVAVTLGRGSQPTGFVPPPLLGTLDPGEQRVLRLPITIPAPTAGGYTVRGQVDGADQPARFVVTVTTYPWGLAAIAAVLLGVLVVAELRRARKVPRRPGWTRPREVDPLAGNPSSAGSGGVRGRVR